MKILIAEDEPISRHLVERFLVQWGYEAVVAKDGDEAWWILQQEGAPKLAILDWMMPGMSGVQICREIRKRTEDPYIYLILLTAKTQKPDLIEGLEAGADDYLTKPFDADELRVRLRAGRRILDLQDHLIAAREAARFPATRDFLTGLWNREAILGILRRELVRDVRERLPAAIILVNLDHFKFLNTTHGPVAGDTVLREAARRLHSAARICDSIGRYGGKEFLVVLPGCDVSEALDQAERLRACLSGEPVDILGGAIPVTASLGVVTTDGAKDANCLLRVADTAVHRAKLGGRNRVELSETKAIEEDLQARAEHH